MSEPPDHDDLGGAVDRFLMQRIVRRDLLSVPTRDSSDPSSILQPIWDGTVEGAARLRSLIETVRWLKDDR